LGATARRALLAAGAAAAATAAAITPAAAHGFGQRYDLPLPLSLYLAGTAIAVVVTFLIFALFVRQVAHTESYPRLDLAGTALGRLLASPALVLPIRLASLALFVIMVLAGFVGDQNPYRNLAPTMTWVIVWVGLAYVSAFIGDLWSLINPWRTLFDAAQWMS